RLPASLQSGITAGYGYAAFDLQLAAGCPAVTFCGRGAAMQPSTDVLVVGGGPVGLLLAGELQRRGIDYLLIEAKKEPVYFWKALGVSPGTLEFFDQIGVLDEALDRGLWLGGQVTAVNGADIRRSDFRSQESRYFTLVLAQYDTEDILRVHLR